MSYSGTTNLGLRKDGSDEKIRDWRPHMNQNLDIIDQEIQNIIDSDVVVLKEGDGSSAGPISELTADSSEAEQFTTTGKNLLGGLLETIKSINTAGTWNGNAYTYNGITYHIYSDGSIKVSGTIPGAYDSKLFFVNGGSFVIEPGTYTLSGATSNVLIRLYEANNTNGFSTDGASSVTQTIDEQRNYNRAYLHVMANASVAYSVVYATIRPQLELGSTATSYEPYTGGIISPNPDYPQDIQVYRGRNLLQITATSQTVNGVTFTVNSDDSIMVSGTATELIEYELFTKNTAHATLFPDDYVISGCPSGGSSSTWSLDIRFSGTSVSSGTYIVDYGSGGSFTLTTNGTYLNRSRIVIRSGVTIDATFRPQLERGSIARPYVPYGHVGVDVRTRNLLNPADRVSAGDYYGGLTSSYNGEYVTVSGTSTHTSNDVTQVFGSDESSPAINGGGTYTLTWDGDYLPDNFRVQAICDFGTSAQANYYMTGDNKTMTFTAQSQVTFVRFHCLAALNGTTVNVTGRFMLEDGNTAHPYVPYMHEVIPIPLPERGWAGGLPDGTSDELKINSAGKVKWTKRTNEVVLNGTESWSLSSSGKRVFSSMTPRMRVTSKDVNANVVCTHFLPRTNEDTLDGTQGISWAMTSTNTDIYIADGSDSMTVSAWTTWLASNNVTLLYPLEIPITEDVGYVKNWPEIPDGSTLTVPEFGNLSVIYYADGSVSKLAYQWYDRAYAELGGAITELAARVAALEA